MRRLHVARLPRLPGFSAVFASLAVLAAGLSACSGGSHPAAPAARSASSLSWHNCPNARVAMRCATLTVPLDYAHPHGRTITLALSEIPATAPSGQRLGPLLVNPGGPGGSGLELPPQLRAALPAAVAARYDIIGFDPRGVGDSRPALHCDPSFFAGVQPPYPATSRTAGQMQAARAYAAGCERRFGWLLPHMTTADNARDLEAIRAALGVPKINYYGVSWGTYLGEVYATMFPGHVRRMVLDSVVDPTGWSYKDGLMQAPAAQRRMVAFFTWIAQHDAVYRLGRTTAQVTAQYEAALHALTAHPVRGKSGQPLIGPDELAETIVSAIYSTSLWPPLASGLAAYLHGHRTAALVFLDRNLATDENEFAVFNAVTCADAASPRSWARWDADARRIARTAPLLAWPGNWYSPLCPFWPVRPPAKPMTIGAPGLPGILMLQGTLDAPTPYAGALQARRSLPTARMVVVSGGGDHGQAVTSPPNTCVNGYLARYLATGALPSGSGPIAATCASLPPPPASVWSPPSA
ncbi:MAG TPA: alpha/beta hydrolase [Streptosporangiaceae bacterium]|jgi:pimeloyl-ACP methyl ester carboxylesterase|nr:alpha/beta hydrolase [Streptosporangiaceae bacterium]